MTKKKSGFGLFICSLMPGAGEMYMGFMKMGLSLMALFLLVFGIGNLLDSNIFLLADMLIWFYSFFHVHNIAGMPDDQFAALQDDYLIHTADLKRMGMKGNNAYRKIMAAVLIFLGVVLLWKDVVFHLIRKYLGLSDTVKDILWDVNDLLPKLVISIVIIVLGIRMIRGKKKELEENENDV